MARNNAALARPPAGTRLCAVDDIADPASKAFRFEVEGNLFLAFIVRSGDLLQGYVNSCPHDRFPMGWYGTDQLLTPANDRIFCPVHMALFTLDGEGVTAPCIGMSLTPWEIEVRDGVIYTGEFVPAVVAASVR